MRHLACFVLVLSAALSGVSSFAAPPPTGGGGRYGYGGGGVAPAHSPVYGHGGWYGGRYGGWYGGGYRYPYYGFGYRYPYYGFGLGYGAGWALGYPGYYWGAPYYQGYPYGYALSSVPAFGVSEDLAYVQQPQNEAVNPPAQQSGAGYWYYCTAPAGYYPSVARCTRPWIAVDPQTGTAARQ